MKKQYSKNFKNTYIKEKLKEKNAYQLFLNISIFILKKQYFKYTVYTRKS